MHWFNNQHLHGYLNDILPVKYEDNYHGERSTQQPIGNQQKQSPPNPGRTRSAIRGLFRVADSDLGFELDSVLTSGDDYESAAKPQIDWDDSVARDALIDSRARDTYACLAVLDGRELTTVVGDAAELLATVVGQDIEADNDGMFRIIRGTATDRVISTVDVDARHGRKTTAHRFDGYKGHIAIDPGSEIITNTTVGAANAGDAGDAEHHDGENEAASSANSDSGPGDTRAVFIKLMARS